MNLNNVQSFTNGSGAALAAYRWVALRTDGTIEYADKDTANARVLGTTLEDRELGSVEIMDVSLHNTGAVHWATAGGAIALGADVQLGDDGKVVTLATLESRGVAMSAATGDGSVIRVLVGGGAGAGRPRGEGAIPTQSQTTLTDSSTGSATTTLAAVTNPTFGWNGATDPSAAEGTAINAAITSLKNSVASLAAELALIKTDVANILTFLA